MDTAWMDSGRPYWEDRKEELSSIFDGVAWQPLSVDLVMPAMVGLGIDACLKELPLPRPSAVAWSHEMAPFGLLAVRANYNNGQAEVFICDHGDGCAVMCSRFWPPEAMSLARLGEWKQRAKYSTPAIRVVTEHVA